MDLPLYEHRALRQHAITALGVLLGPVFVRTAKERLLTLESHSPNRMHILQTAFDLVCSRVAVSEGGSPCQPSERLDCSDAAKGQAQDVLSLLQTCALSDSVKKVRLCAVKLICLLMQRTPTSFGLQGTVLTLLTAKACDPHPPVRYHAVEHLCPLLQSTIRALQGGMGAQAPAQPKRVAAVLARLVRVMGHPACDEAAPPQVRQAVAEALLEFLRGSEAVALSGQQFSAQRIAAKQLCTERLAVLLGEFQSSEQWQMSVLLQPILQQL